MNDELHALREKLKADPDSVFICYSHDTPDHMSWVERLGQGLVDHGFQVALDSLLELSAMPTSPQSVDELFELSKRYDALFRNARLAGDFATIASPQPLTRDAGLRRYSESIGGIASLMSVCQNIVLISTPAFMRDTITESGSPGGWVFLEFQLLLTRLVAGESPPRVVSVLREGGQAHFRQADTTFPVLDFRLDEVMSANLDCLADYLRLGVTTEAWRYLSRDVLYGDAGHPAIAEIDAALPDSLSRTKACTYLGRFLALSRSPLGKWALDCLLPRFDLTREETWIGEARERGTGGFLELKRFSTAVELHQGLGALLVARQRGDEEAVMSVAAGFHGELGSLIRLVMHDDWERRGLSRPVIGLNKNINLGTWFSG